MTHVDLRRLRTIAEMEFADIVVEVLTPDLNQLRIILKEEALREFLEFARMKMPRPEQSASSPQVSGQALACGQRKSELKTGIWRSSQSNNK